MYTGNYELPERTEHMSWRTKPEPIGENEISASYETDIVVVGLGCAGGAIAGTKAGEYIRCLAKKAVVLAAGDFSGNRKMVEELRCDISDLFAPGDKLPPSFGRRGRGHQLGVWACGRLEARPLPAVGGSTVTPMGPCAFGALWLDRDGRR